MAADPADVFRLLCDPQGHVAVDSSGMLMDGHGRPVFVVGDTFVVHMDREALNDYPMGHYDVTVQITAFVPDREIAWTILGEIIPVGHVYGYQLEAAEGGTRDVLLRLVDHRPGLPGAGIFPVSPRLRCGPPSASSPGRLPRRPDAPSGPPGKRGARATGWS